MFEVPAGGRRFRALELLVKQKRMAKTQPVPCVVREGGLGEEDSLAENVQRVALHPLDQFRAFQTLREKGLSEEEIAARFFVNPTVVKQRLKLTAVSDKLLDVYAEDGMTLEQLMAFTVTNDHARQEQVWESLARAYNKEPYYIRRQLTEGAVRAADKRARFVGVDIYEAAGGIVLRDLFQYDDGGWLQDPARPPGDREAPGSGRDPSRRGLEVDRGRARLPLWAHRRPAPPERRDHRSHRRGACEPRRLAGRI
jgi:ParB family chromosome partitioning protein